MLVAAGSRSFGDAAIRSTLLFDQRFWGHVVERRGLTFDSRFMPRAMRSSRSAVLYLVLRGTFRVEHLGHVQSFCMVEDDYEGAGERPPLRFRAEGDPYSAVDLRLDRRDVLVDASAGPVPFELDAAGWAAARSLAAATELSAATSATRSLMDALERAQVVRHGVAAGIVDGDHRFSRLWAAVAPVVSEYQALSSLKVLAAGSALSLRHVAREVQGFLDAFGVLGSSWREVTRRSRLKLAVLWLSAADASVADVARIAGYGSTEAMARAFRDADLPPPLIVRKSSRATASPERAAWHEVSGDTTRAGS